MNTIREQLNKPVITLVVGFVIGLFIGLVVLGWWLWPVDYYDAAPANLHPGYQEMYLRAIIQAYSANKTDIAAAKANFDSLGEAGADTLERVKANPGALDMGLITEFSQAVQVALPETPAATPVAEGEEEESSGVLKWLPLLGVFCLVVLLLGGAIIGFFWLQSRKGKAPGEKTAAEQALDAARQAEWTDYTAIGEESPMAQFMSSYRIGDDLFDESFSIDSPSGEFLGECGVGISETIGVGDPKKVTAFEVWVFDKNDIQTVTKVIMSSHAFNDNSIRQRLEAKGEPVLAEPGGQTVLETATLRLVARVVDMTFGEGALPEQSYFDGLILELAIWQK
ncbi:MAG: hypothetical protein JW726_18290 [Anaerolineales bacterium]|nr:hypothetical protein [Anaerolineales bacterium]